MRKTDTDNRQETVRAPSTLPKPCDHDLRLMRAVVQANTPKDLELALDALQRRVIQCDI